MKYHIAHLSIALAVCVFLHITVSLDAGVFAGLTIYISREITQLECLHKWDLKKMDWKGLFWPVGGILIYFLIFKYLLQ